jgi:signal transduction histidine kinase
MIFYRRQKKASKPILFKASQEDRNNALEKQVEMQQLTLQKIAAEIHDNVTLTLSLSKLYLHDLNYDNRSELHDKINLCVHLIKKALSDLSNISRSINSDGIEKFSFIKSVETLVHDVQTARLFTINLSMDGSYLSIGSNNEVILFRIIQESLSNIIKHSNANNVHINLKFTAESVLVEVTDDGIGFNTAEVSPGSGLGNMKKRAEILNATLSLTSSPGKGTSVNINIPIQTINQLNEYRKSSR